MKFTAYSLVFSCLSVLLFNSCKNDLKLNAPYKEIPSIYAMLNPQDKIQMIRINKVFLGEGDANQMAQVADSINYPAGDLLVTLTRFSNGSQIPATPNGNKQVITFRDSVVQAADGAFNKTQRVYVTSDPLFKTGDYVLTVKNIKTNNVFTARSTALDSINGSTGIRPLTINPLYPYPPNTSLAEYVDYQNYDISVRYLPNEAKLYQLVIRMHFYDSLFNHQKTYNYVDYAFGNKNAKDVEKIGLASYINNTAKRADLFAATGINLGKMKLNDNIYGRKMYKIEFLIYSTTQDYLDYLQFVSPSLSITQNKPLYSNFKDRAALGIFTFRTRCSVVKEMSTSFISEFAYNKSTCIYRFYTAQMGQPGCN